MGQTCVVMVSVNDIRARQFVSRAFCGIVLALGLAPSALQASCGQHVTSKTSRSARGPRVDLRDLRVTAVQAAGVYPYHPARDRTCSGFYCSRTPGAPSALPSSDEQRTELWWGITDVSWHGVLERGAPLACSSKLHPRHLTFPPQRPPRAPRLAPICW